MITTINDTIHKPFNNVNNDVNNITITINNDSNGYITSSKNEHHYMSIVKDIERMITNESTLTIINNADNNVKADRISELMYVINDYVFKDLHYITNGCELMSSDFTRKSGLIIGTLINNNLTMLTMKADRTVNPDKLARAVGLLNSNARNVKTMITAHVSNETELKQIINDYDWIVANELNITADYDLNHHEQHHDNMIDISDYDISMLTRFTPVNIIHAGADSKNNELMNVINDDNIDYENSNVNNAVHNKVRELVNI